MAFSFRRVIACLLATCLGTVAWSTDIIGSATINGKDINILSDGTWAYADGLSQNCETVVADVIFCAEAGKWTSRESQDPRAILQLEHKAGLFAIIVRDDTGLSSGLDMAGYRDAIMNTVIANAGGSPSDVTQYGSVDVTFLGRPSETMIYHVTRNGVPLLFFNSYVVRERDAWQVVTIEQGTTSSDFHAPLHADLLKELQTRE